MKVTRRDGESNQAIAETNILEPRRRFGRSRPAARSCFYQGLLGASLRSRGARALSGLMAVILALSGVFSQANAQGSNPVLVQITGDTHVRVAGRQAGTGILVSENTLPRGSVVEIYAKSYNNPVRHYWWNLTSRRAPIDFVQGVRIISAPGFTKAEVDELNRINARSGLYIAKSELRRGRLVQATQGRRQVGLSQPASLMFNETNRRSSGRNAGRASNRDRDNASAFDQAAAGLNQATAAVNSAGQAGAPQGRCDLNGVYQRALRAGVPERPLKRALAYFSQQKGRIPNQRYVTIVDFTQPSNAKRMFIIDTTNGQVTRHLSAHGIGSDGSGGRVNASRMSNRINSHATPAGFHLAAEVYKGSKGLSMRLNGLESRNSNSRARGVVVHGANYVTPEFANRYGRVGRSWGCPSVDPRELGSIIGRLKGGSLFYNYNGE